MPLPSRRRHDDVMKRRWIRGHAEGPTTHEVKELADWLHIRLTDEEVREYTEIIGDRLVAVCDTVDELPAPFFEIRYPRTPGYRPTVEDDPLNLFITMCDIPGADDGLLAGKRAVLKDNIAVAGLPMTNGNRDLQSLVPQFDAVVVERLLDAGARIVGKLNQDDFSISGSSDTSSFGSVRNPFNPEFSAGGSSSGQGAAVRVGIADVALGVDQAGSGRMPAAWSGVCSIKGTHGLVPSFGIFHHSHTFDHICPAARTVEEVAVALEALAGDDPRDPQWVRGEIKTDRYSKRLKGGLEGLTVGVVTDAFDWPFSQADVDEAVRAAIQDLQDAGARVREVSIPLWRDGWDIWTAVLATEITTLIENNEQGLFHGGYTSPEFAQAYGALRRRGHSLPPRMKMVLIMGLYLRRKYDNYYYCRAQNIRQVLKRQINEALNEVDVLVTPTSPLKALKLMEEDVSQREWSHELSSSPRNTLPLDLTGHPAFVMPCGIGEHHLPISIQFIGRHWDEATLFRVAHAYEQMIPDLYRELERRTEEVLDSVGGFYRNFTLQTAR